MRYGEIRYVPEEQDPSRPIETEELVAKVIDNTGLLVRETAGWKSYAERYALGHRTPYSHHLGYHGIRCLYDKNERRNLVVPGVSWLNLQGVALAGVENDPVDERAAYEVGRGWPVRMAAKDSAIVLRIPPQPQTQFEYSLALHPVEPDTIEFTVRFVFHKKPDDGPVRFRASWPCYMNAYDDLRFYYPAADAAKTGRWSPLGEKPDVVLGDPVNYQHRQTRYDVQDPAFPVGFGRLGDRALILMFDDPTVKFFVVNAGGHPAFSSVQNPAWDFQWEIADYPLDTPVGFTGRLIYTAFDGEAAVLARYRAWMGGRGE